MLLIDDYTRMAYATFLREKVGAFEEFKGYKMLVENETGRRIKCLRLDRGGEYISREFMEYYEDHGIRRQYSAPRSSQQNGILE